MRRLNQYVAGAVMSIGAIVAPAAAQSENLTSDYVSPIAANAENIRSLNIMLMVTSLRCRATAHDFSGEYELFARTHQQNLEEAHNHLTRDMVATYGERGSDRALDRIGVSIANSYGDGHPTLGCSALKEATLELAMSQDKAELAQMADRLLAGPTILPESTVETEIAEPAISNAAKQRPKKAHAPTAPRPAENDEGQGTSISPSRVPSWMRG